MLFVFYVLRSLLKRARANAITLLTVALFVAGSTLGLAYYLSLKERLVSSTPPENILVLAEGAPSEAGSRIDLETARQLALLDGIQREGDEPLVARELVSAVSLDTGDVTQYEPPVPFRGIDELSLRVHDAEMVEGSAPAPGTLQVILGRRVAERFPRVGIGSEIQLPAGPGEIAGIFAAEGGPLEDEIWTDRAALEMHLNEKVSSSVTLVAENTARAAELVERINGSKNLNAQAAPVAEFVGDQAGLETVAWAVMILLVFLLIVAVFAIASTMHAAIAMRMSEFASMAALGIRKSILGRIVIMESAVLGAAGAVIGVALSEVLRMQLGTVSLGTSPIEVPATATAAGAGLALGLLVGLVGGVAPALRVRRLQLKTALR